MKISDQLTDDAILAELGERVARCRLRLQLTQAQLAQQAGVGKRTVERLEGGGSTQLTSLIRILRVLDLLEGLEHVFPDTGPTPMELLRGKGKPKQRVRASRATEREPGPWQWRDDT
jgi:transcriptional regulator with XRE-family HTH domain